ncbi:helix-turn-helix domain-containing protein [Enterococcus durans]|uniref:helix-turn-helix domain-containing protein n=1 Tax=Enterococcus durans TaxID=53345 RepID=UPI0038BB84ED
MRKKVEVKRTEFQVILELGDDTSLEQICLFLLQQSLKFNLLTYLLEHQQASIVRLATAFNISESSVFRKIKELNHLLKEFLFKSKWTNLWGRTTSSVLLLCPLSIHPRISTTSFLTEYTGKTTIDPRVGTFGRNNFFSGCINKNCLLVRNHEETTNE